MQPITPLRRLPSPTAFLLIADLLSLATAHILPRQTTTLPHRTLNVEPWPLATAPALLPRQEPNTVCGYIDADPDLPVTCGLGSHCVVDRGAGAVGCCPNGEACTTGVFTGCVDGSSNGRREVDPYVYTCSGSEVCYENVFDGGLTQVGCGTGTGLAGSVATAAEGKTAVRYETVSLGITGKSTSETSTTSTSETSSETSSETASETSSETGTTTESAAETATGAAEAPETEGGVNQTGAIVGGTLSGVAVLAALIALIFFLWRRKKGNSREGPPTLDTKYIRYVPFLFPSSPTVGYDVGFERIGTDGNSPMSNSLGFTPITTSNEYPETDFLSDQHPVPPAPTVPRSPTNAAHSERAPLAGEFDDFHRGVSEAVGNIREEAPARGAVGVDRPLWQQNRRQSRNMMWM